MIAYGYEQPAVIEAAEIFNPTTANMVLLSMADYGNILRDDYNKAADKAENFIKEYGQFTSPIDADVLNYYNMTTGGIGKMFDAALALGVDLLRSPEGRAIVLRFIMSRPYSKLSKLREAAETAKLYKTLLANGIANGTLDYETAIKLDGDMSKWNSLYDGVWDKVAPTAQKTINQVLAPYIEDLYKRGYEYDPVASEKRGEGWIVKTVSDQAIEDELNKNAHDIMKDPMMKLRAEEMGLTPEQFIKSLLYTHMRRELTPQETEDKNYWERLHLNLKIKELNETIRHNKQSEGNKNGSTSHQYTDRVAMGTVIKQQLIYSQANPNAHLAYWKDQMKYAKTDKDKQRVNKWITSWSNFSKMDKKHQDEWLKKQGYIDENGYTLKFIEQNNKVNSFTNTVHGDANGLLSSRSARNQAERIYSGYLAPVTGNDATTSLAAIGTLNKDGYYYGSFKSGGHGRLQYSRARAKDFTGVHMNKNGIEKAFDSWLKTNVSSAKLYNTSSLYAGALPNGRLEVSGMEASIPYSRIKSFINMVKSANNNYTLYNGKKAKFASEQEILDDLGLSVLDEQNNPTTVTTRTKGTDTSTSQTSKTNPKWIIIPTSGGVNAIGENTMPLNDMANSQYGTGGTYKESGDSQLSAVEFSLQ